ncbi:NUDIX hydrolase [Streptomyces sp. H10-C2]|uniref:NUDIX hydrolase n=1 Tax=unclassified Streptomyces TaxID=2593676 RepID=UPI0024BB1BE3|nr:MULTISPECIES: NUDIX hydrolase [unclassified Streptomyces]MDJ0342847.1 NUDIX hydrolase [Streptomyces sp. PH10-H1]MDJ0372525.1 NUDIX hydrolase [Streptomyces sp. H10-C2]
MDASLPREPRDASVVVARDERDQVALLTSRFPRHGGEFLFLPGGKMEPGETPEQCGHRELCEESGITAESLRPLGSYAITLGFTARVHLYLAQQLTLGPQQLQPSEADFKLMWWPMRDAITAATEGRFLLQGGPLALLLADRL